MKVVFIKNDKEYIVEGEEGLSLFEIAHKNGVDIHGNCGGAMACGSCHVKIDEKWLDLVGSGSEDEQNVLDIVFGVDFRSRLSCQVIFEKSLDGIRVEIVE